MPFLSCLTICFDSVMEKKVIKKLCIICCLTIFCFRYCEAKILGIFEVNSSWISNEFDYKDVNFHHTIYQKQYYLNTGLNWQISKNWNWTNTVHVGNDKVTADLSKDPILLEIYEFDRVNPITYYKRNEVITELNSNNKLLTGFSTILERNLGYNLKAGAGIELYSFQAYSLSHEVSVSLRSFAFPLCYLRKNIGRIHPYVGFINETFGRTWYYRSGINYSIHDGFYNYPNEFNDVPLQSNFQIYYFFGTEYDISKLWKARMEVQFGDEKKLLLTVGMY